MDHDGQLLAVYAQDIYGLVWWETGQVRGDPEKKEDYYNKAFEWFETCIYTEDDGPDYLRVITSGYYHIAQAGLDAGRMPKRNFARGRPRPPREDARPPPDGVAHRQRPARDGRVVQARVRARATRARPSRSRRTRPSAPRPGGQAALERLANRQLNVYVSGGCGGSRRRTRPRRAPRVADDLFVTEKYPDAIRAYRTVIEASPNTAQAFLATAGTPGSAWRRPTGELGDRLGEALAYEPIHEAWMNGLIPRVGGRPAPQRGACGSLSGERAEGAQDGGRQDGLAACSRSASAALARR